MNQGVPSALATLSVPQSNLGLFDVVQNYPGYAVNDSDHPAKAGEIVILWGTGLGGAPVTVTVGGQDAQVVYAGPQGQFEGDDNIYFTLPAGLTSGCGIAVSLQVGGRPVAGPSICVGGTNP